MQDLVEAQQLLPFALLQPGDRDPGPGRDDLGDLVLGDHLAQQPAFTLLDRELLLLSGQPALQLGELSVAQFGGTVEVIGPLGLLNLPAGLLQLGAQLLNPPDRLALGVPLRAHRVGLGP